MERALALLCLMLIVAHVLLQMAQDSELRWWLTGQRGSVPLPKSSRNPTLQSLFQLHILSILHGIRGGRIARQAHWLRYGKGGAWPLSEATGALDTSCCCRRQPLTARLLCTCRAHTPTDKWFTQEHRNSQLLATLFTPRYEYRVSFEAANMKGRRCLTFGYLGALPQAFNYYCATSPRVRIR